MQEVSKYSNGALRYQLGHGYKECKTTQELNEWTQEERLSKCGFLGKSWNKSGRTTGNQLTRPLPENNDHVVVFCAEKSKRGE